MTWHFQHGDWLLRSDAGKLLGRVYQIIPYGWWAAETELNGLTTGPGDLEWAQQTLWKFCLVQYPEKKTEPANV